LFPQLPQLAGSECASTQLLPHLVVPPAQDQAHAPCEQTRPGAQALPHAPQLVGSLERLTQVPAQLVWLLSQDDVPSALASEPTISSAEFEEPSHPSARHTKASESTAI
jgi:hypothetical protein